MTPPHKGVRGNALRKSFEIAGQNISFICILASKTVSHTLLANEQSRPIDYI